jgi:hypothetical protein
MNGSFASSVIHFDVLQFDVVGVKKREKFKKRCIYTSSIGTVGHLEILFVSHTPHISRYIESEWIDLRYFVSGEHERGVIYMGDE